MLNGLVGEIANSPPERQRNLLRARELVGGIKSTFGSVSKIVETTRQFTQDYGITFLVIHQVYENFGDELAQLGDKIT